MKKHFVTYALPLYLFCALCICFQMQPAEAVAAEDGKQQELVDRAKVTFQSFIRDQSIGWYPEDSEKIRGLLIIPSQLKGGLILGGSGGSGVLLAKDPESGEWSYPGFYTVGALSLGLQIGAEASEVIMVVRSDRALTKLYTSTVKFNGDTSIAIGPVGAGAKASLLADIITYSRSKGAYAGVSLEGALVKINHDSNEAYYGKEVQPVDIYVQNNVSNPGAQELIQAVSQAENFN